MCFNLVDKRWIPVLHRDGRYERVGIQQALTESGHIRQIAASNPLDNVASLRFLQAVLLWSKGDLTDEDRALLNDDADGIPESWLKNLNEHKAKFNLLGDGERFYQDASLKDKDARPIADLLVEFPGADSVNHMRHVVHDGSYGFCPACCALGVLRLSVWAPANRFYPASVNPGSAAYAIIQKSNLLLMLVANLPESPSQVGQAPWSSNAAPDSPDTVARLAWRPRKLWLNVASKQDACANCGRSDTLVESLCNEGGWSTPMMDRSKKKFWDCDPHLLKEGEPISLPGLVANVAAHSSRFWREALRLRHLGTDRVAAIGPVVNKFVFHDATSVNLPNAAVPARVELSKDCSDNLRVLLKKVTPNSERQHPEIKAGLVRLTPDTESRIRATLNETDATVDDGKLLRETYQPAVQQVVASTTPGSPLRRRAAMINAQASLDKKIADLVRKANGASAEVEGDSPTKTKRRRKKTKGAKP